MEAVAGPAGRSWLLGVPVLATLGTYAGHRWILRTWSAALAAAGEVEPGPPPWPGFTLVYWLALVLLAAGGLLGLSRAGRAVRWPALAALTAAMVWLLDALLGTPRPDLNL